MPMQRRTERTQQFENKNKENKTQGKHEHNLSGKCIGIWTQPLIKIFSWILSYVDTEVTIKNKKLKKE